MKKNLANKAEWQESLKDMQARLKRSGTSRADTSPLEKIPSKQGS